MTVVGDWRWPGKDCFGTIKQMKPKTLLQWSNITDHYCVVVYKSHSTRPMILNSHKDTSKKLTTRVSTPLRTRASAWWTYNNNDLPSTDSLFEYGDLNVQQ